MDTLIIDSQTEKVRKNRHKQIFIEIYLHTPLNNNQSWLKAEKGILSCRYIVPQSDKEDWSEQNVLVHVAQAKVTWRYNPDLIMWAN